MTEQDTEPRVDDDLDPTPEEDSVTTETEAETSRGQARPGGGRWGYAVAAAIVVALAAVAGWLGVQVHQNTGVAAQDELYLQTARQGAINLTSIDFVSADADIQRILDSATGSFYSDFSQRSQPFVQVVKQTKSKTVGTVTEAAVESTSDTGARVLVAVNVQTSNASGTAPQPRAWRMRVTVDRVGEDEAKMSNVEFVA